MSENRWKGKLLGSGDKEVPPCPLVSEIPWARNSRELVTLTRELGMWRAVKGRSGAHMTGTWVRRSRPLSPVGQRSS
jgi:hypothetical protein